MGSAHSPAHSHQRVVFASVAPLGAGLASGKDRFPEDLLQGMEAYLGVDAATLSTFVGEGTQTPTAPPNEGVRLIMKDRAWNVPQRVPHQEVPENRRCQQVVVPGPQQCHDTRRRIICSCVARMRFHQGYAGPFAESIETLKLKFLSSPMSESCRTALGQFAQMAVAESTVRKAFSHWGAVRVTKERAMRILQSAESLNNFIMNLQMEAT